jgi:hypothetical protein
MPFSDSILPTPSKILLTPHPPPGRPIPQRNHNRPKHPQHKRPIRRIRQLSRLFWLRAITFRLHKLHRDTILRIFHGVRTRYQRYRKCNLLPQPSRNLRPFPLRQRNGRFQPPNSLPPLRPIRSRHPMVHIRPFHERIRDRGSERVVYCLREWELGLFFLYRLFEFNCCFRYGDGWFGRRGHLEGCGWGYWGYGYACCDSVADCGFGGCGGFQTCEEGGCEGDAWERSCGD